MAEQFVNRYAIEIGRCGLNGKSFQVHARPDDLEALARRLLEHVELFRRGETPMQRVWRQEGWRLLEEEPVMVMSEYVTLSQERTDRISLSFWAEDSLERHHVIKRPERTVHSLGLAAAKLLWFIVLPVCGAIAVGLSAIRFYGF